MLRSLSAFVAVMAVALLVATTPARAQEVTIGYQLVYNPWKVAIADGEFEKATGYKINWKKFDSGSKVITAMASGDVHIALAGSSPIAAGVSRGLPIELFWIAEDIASAEALVVRDGSGILAPQDLVGKRLGVPFVSTTHFHTLFALEQFGIDPGDVRILNMQPPNISAAWERGDIDAAFVWDPALGVIKKSGKVLITSGLLSSWGKATFDGLVASKEFAGGNRDFMCQFVSTIAKADEQYRMDPNSFGPGTDNAKKIANLVGGDDTGVKTVLDLYDFPNLEEQGSSRWIGGGMDGGAARALKFTSEFLLQEKKIDALLPDYGAAVNDTYIQDALNGC